MLSSFAIADDFVIGFEDQHDAERVFAVVPKRFGRFGLTVHPTKTKLVPFRPPSLRTTGTHGSQDDQPGIRPVGIHPLLGSISTRLLGCETEDCDGPFQRAVRNIDSWCQANRHLSIPEQQQKLNQKLRGHYAYYGVTGNSAALSRFLFEVKTRWQKWLLRRNAFDQ